jgi:hypothetical protein
MDDRPTQLEVDAQAAAMFGEGWKHPFEHAKAEADLEIAWRLDAARLAVEAAHNG